MSNNDAWDEWLKEDHTDDDLRVATDAEIGTVRHYAAELLRLTAQEAVIAERLARVQEARRVVEEKYLPEAMQRIGLRDFTTDHGQCISIETHYAASITEARKDDAFAWLRDHGHGALIKRNVAVQFGKGEDAKAITFLELIRNYYPQQATTDKTSVHPQTLKAFVKTELEGGRDVPFDLLGVHIVQKAKISK